jgi:hypothetical protein
MKNKGEKNSTEKKESKQMDELTSVGSVEESLFVVSLHPHRHQLG